MTEQAAAGVFTACLMHGGKKAQTLERSDNDCREIKKMKCLGKYGRCVCCLECRSGAAEPTARVSKTTLGKISLAHNIHCCPNFCYFFCKTSVSILRTIYIYIYKPYIYIYTHTHTYLTPYRLYVNYRCYQITLQ